jgi:hypothetical protein
VVVRVYSFLLCVGANSKCRTRDHTPLVAGRGLPREKEDGYCTIHETYEIMPSSLCSVFCGSVAVGSRRVGLGKPSTVFTNPNFFHIFGTFGECQSRLIGPGGFENDYSFSRKNIWPFEIFANRYSARRYKNLQRNQQLISKDSLWVSHTPSDWGFLIRFTPTPIRTP